jgi:hypothetical protein
MKFCISQERLRGLVEAEISAQLDANILKFQKAGLSIQEMFQQMDGEYGPFNEAVEESTSKFSNKTEFVEVQIALTLLDIYHLEPKDQLKICFKMKHDYRGVAINSLSDLVNNIENYTHVDFSILGIKREWRFQVKRYRFESFDSEKVISYLGGIFGKYGNMDDTNLVILLQSSEKGKVMRLDAEQFRKIHRQLLLMKEKVSFGDISFIFNSNMTEMLLVRVYPDFAKGKTSLVLRGEKYQEIQKHWRERQIRNRI